MARAVGVTEWDSRTDNYVRVSLNCALVLGGNDVRRMVAGNDKLNLRLVKSGR